MFASFELLAIGAAAVFDVVLLLVIVDRANRHLTANWLKLAITGVTFWHAASFVHLIVQKSDSVFAVRLDDACMICMSCGLVLMNCGILHGALRLNRTGLITHPPTDFRYLLVYVPLLLVFDASARIITGRSREFAEAVRTDAGPFLIWMLIANITTAFLFYRNRPNIAAATSRLLKILAGTCVAVTGIVTCYVAQLLLSDTNQWLRLFTAVSPVAPTLLFAWFIFRRQLTPLIFERTLVYGAILLAVVFVHRLLISQVLERASQRIQIDLLVVEGLIVVAAILSISPLRKRVRDGLRYLVSEDVHVIRDKAMNISVAMAKLTGNSVKNRSEWLTAQLQSALALQFVELRLTTPVDVVSVKIADDCPANLRPAVHQTLAVSPSTLGDAAWLERTRCRTTDEMLILQSLNALAILPILENRVQGFLVLGLRKRGDRLNDEQLNAVRFLVEQFSATLEGVLQNKARQEAEHRAAQQEKLSTLGLLSGSMAHEIRNPLSSIRTIASLLKEDLPDDSEATQEIQLIIDEVDRLSETTQRLLDFSRPADPDQNAIPDQMIPRLLGVLNHLAQKHSVKITCELTTGNATAQMTDADLTDVLFNLIKNAIEAATESSAGQVTIRTSVSSFLQIEVIDNGSGIDPGLQHSLFDPFVTGKAEGTGMGLFLVDRHLKEAGGSIQHRRLNPGTAFIVEIPPSR